jgi:hypothetical protein
VANIYGSINAQPAQTKPVENLEEIGMEIRATRHEGFWTVTVNVPMKGMYTFRTTSLEKLEERLQKMVEASDKKPVAFSE